MNQKELERDLRARFPRENDACEWKEWKSLKHAVTGRQGDDVASYTSAISNVAGGHIILGVKDKTLDVVGLTEFHGYTPESICHRVVDFCTNLNSEGFKVETHRTTDTNREVWIFHIPRHRPRLPVYAHGKAWQRVGDSLVQMRSERLQAILSEPVEASDWSAAIVERSTIADLDPPALEKAREKYKERNAAKPWRAEIDEWDWPTFLDKAKLTAGGQITRTCLLLLGKENAAARHLSPHPAQITWKLDAEDKAYQHFGPPFVLATTELLRRVRNVPQKLFPNNQLLPVEIQKYETRSILEGLHNCIAHQDYERQERILVTEQPDRLIFENAGSFFDGKPEEYFKGKRTARRYRNTWLAHAMSEVNMIDTLGYGIHEMTKSQRGRYLPLPDYRLSTDSSVVLEVLGRPIDEKYSQLLLERHDLDIDTVILLDRVQKGLPITDEAASRLRRDRLIDGRRPNLRVAASITVAVEPRESERKVKPPGKDDFQKVIVGFLIASGGATREAIDTLIIPLLPAVLTDKQKKDRVKNLLSEMRRSGLASPNKDGRGAVWRATSKGSAN